MKRTLIAAMFAGCLAPAAMAAIPSALSAARIQPVDAPATIHEARRGRGADDAPGDDRGRRRGGKGADDAPGDDRKGRGRGTDDGPNHA